MAKEDSMMRVEGEIVDVLPNATFKVKLENNVTILAYLAGKLRQHEIRVLLGDRVDVDISAYDVTRGRIVRRK